MAESVIEFLRGYVAIPSVNPMGRSDLPADIVGEGAYAAHLQAQLGALSVDLSVDERRWLNLELPKRPAS